MDDVRAAAPNAVTGLTGPERIRAFDWSKTPLGPAESWSPALRTVVRLMLANRLPMLLWWGPHYISIYNDPYRPVLGNKHPWGLGLPVRECWREIVRACWVAETKPSEAS